MRSFQSVLENLFPNDYKLIDGTDDIFELNFALWEYQNLGKEDLIDRSAYFKSIKGQNTIHYQVCNAQNLEDVYKYSSFRTKAFFLGGKYSTGYATHSLFPYRGKFHPQLIRVLLSMIGVKQGDIVLDPMSGSATLSVEANLLNIDSIGFDVSPFCCLMGRVKTFSLNLNPEKLLVLSKDSDKIFKKLYKERVPAYFLKENDSEEKSYFEVFLLAYLDAVGFSRRSAKPLENLFPLVLNRYISTIINFQKARQKLALKIGKSKIKRASITNLPLPDNSVDGIITSPPYSFAIDYVENDRPQLEYLGFDPKDLSEEIIGLNGRGIEEKLKLYFDDIKKSLKEMSRVVKKNSIIVIIVGTNDIQTKGIILQDKIKKIAEKEDLELGLEIIKPIKGMNNTMKNESILFFNNTKA